MQAITFLWSFPFYQFHGKELLRIIFAQLNKWLIFTLNVRLVQIFRKITSDHDQFGNFLSKVTSFMTELKLSTELDLKACTILKKY